MIKAISKLFFNVFSCASLCCASYFHLAAAEEIDLQLYETSFYSPNGEDGIFARLFSMIKTTPMRFCVECGANDGITNSLTYLLRNQGWRALLLDRSFDIPSISLHKEFLTAENINALFEKYAVPKSFDLLTIDTGSNDFYLWKALDERYCPSVVCIAYNGFHKPEEDKVVQYHPFYCGDDSIYFGASMLALYHLGRSKHYALVYAEESGKHLFFVREDLIKNNALDFKNVNDVQKLYRHPSYEKAQGKQRHDPKNRPYLSAKELLNK